MAYFFEKYKAIIFDNGRNKRLRLGISQDGGKHYETIAVFTNDEQADYFKAWLHMLAEDAYRAGREGK